MVAPNFGGGENNKNSDHKYKPFVKFNHPILGWIDCVPVKSWSFSTLKVTQESVGGWNGNLSHSPCDESGSLHKTAATNAVNAKHVAANRGDYLKKIYSRIDRQREQATVHLANSNPSRERIVYDAIVENASGEKVVEPVELFIVHGKAGRVTFARPLAYLSPPFLIEDKSILRDLKTLRMDGLYATKDPVDMGTVAAAVGSFDSAGNRIRFAIHELDLGEQMFDDAWTRLEQGGYARPERGEFDGGADSWKCASERFWAMLEGIYWDWLAVVGGSEVN